MNRSVFRLAAPLLAGTLATTSNARAAAAGQQGPGVPPSACTITESGGSPAGPEVCDGRDNDCDGRIDNPNGGVPLCGDYEDCVKGAHGTQCARPCGQLCPPQTGCEKVTDSATGKDMGFYCMHEPPPCGTDCFEETRKDAKGNVLCAPRPLPAPGCVAGPPVCICNGTACVPACEGVVCPKGTACRVNGGEASCAIDGCPAEPCGCGTACHAGLCVESPCVPGACKADEACKPTSDFDGFACTPSCADVACEAGQRCKDGACIPTCDPPCDPRFTVCDESKSPPYCVSKASACDRACLDGTFCDPILGSCGHDPPCAGVLCPDGQHCNDDECVREGGAGGARATGGHPGGGGSAPHEDAQGDGGGCQCEVGAGAPRRSKGPSIALALLAAALLRARRAERRAKRR